MVSVIWDETDRHDPKVTPRILRVVTLAMEGIEATGGALFWATIEGYMISSADLDLLRVRLLFSAQRSMEFNSYKKRKYRKRV